MAGPVHSPGALTFKQCKRSSVSTLPRGHVSRFQHTLVYCLGFYLFHTDISVLRAGGAMLGGGL